MDFSKTIYLENHTNKTWGRTLDVYFFLLDHPQQREELMKIGRQTCSSQWDPIIIDHHLFDLPIGLLYTSTDYDFCSTLFRRIIYLLRIKGCKPEAQRGRRRSLSHY